MGVPDTLVRRSTLTPVMFESLVSYQRVVRHDLTLKQAASTRKGGPVSIGSYYRTVRQARSNIESSAITILVAVGLGLIDQQEFRKLTEFAGRGLVDLDGFEAERAATLIEALVDKLVIPK